MAGIKKRILKIVFWVVAIFFLLLITPVILLNINSVQNFVAQKVVNSLSETLQTEVKIGYVNLNGFNRLKINDLYVADLCGDTLVSAKNIEGHISILNLFKNRLVVHSFVLENADIRLVMDTTGTLNAAFLKNLFKPKANKPKSVFIFEINDISLKNSTFAFKDLRKISNKTGQINFADILLKEINGEISIAQIVENNFSGNIKSLSFSEISGFKLKNFQTAFLLNDSTCKVTKTKLLLPNSQISLDSIVLTYNNLDSLKTNLAKTGIDAAVLSAKINGKDLAAISPIFLGITNDISLQLEAHGSVENLNITRLNLKYGQEIGLAGTCQASGLPNDLQHIRILASIDNLYGSVSGIQDLMANVLRKPFVLPKPLQNLKKLSYQGKISGYASNLALLGTLTSAVGSIKTDLSLSTNNNFEDMVIDGNISTTGLDLGAVMPSESGFGKIIVTADATIKAGKNVNFESKVNAKINSLFFRNYTYNNLIINGNITKNTFEGSASVDDANGKLNFYGNVELDGENSKFYFDANVRNFKPHNLNLIKNYPNLELNFGMNANFEGNRIDKIRGNLVFEDIAVENNGTFLLKNLTVESKEQTNSLMTTIKSDLLNGYISGNYSFATLPADFMNMLSEYMPILKEKFGQNENLKKNNIGFYFEIEPLQQLCDVLEINSYTTKKATVSGFYNADIKRFNAEIDVPQFRNKAMRFDNANFRCSNDEKNIILYASTMMKNKGDSLSMSFRADFAGNFSNILAQWNNFNDKSVQAGEIYAKTKIYKENDSLMLSANILPTQIVFKNNILDLKNSNISTNFKWIDIDNFTVSGKEENIFINGRASKSENDKIFITLDRFNLDFVNNFLSAQSPLAFGGLVSGDVVISRAFQKPILNANIQVPDFTFNNTLMGFADVTSEFDHERNCLVFNGIVTNAADTNAIVNGGFFFKNDSVDLKGEAKRLNLGFINRFTRNFLDEVGGYGTGKVHVTNLKKHTTVETAAKVDDGHIKIGFLNADFYFSDSIILKKDSILFKKINIFDSEKNKGLLDGYVAHKYMKDFNYKINLQSNKMLLFNAQKGGKAQFYGKAYATGSGTIYGNDEQTNIVCTLTSDPNTKITIPLDAASVAASNDFITFVNSKDEPVQQSKRQGNNNNNNNEETSNMMVDLTLNVNPNAEIQLYIDSRAGDMMRAVGEGNLRINYNGKTDNFTMNGKYDLLEGEYLFTFQDILRKKFKIMDGSSVLFNGSPSNPTIDIKAVYQTEAALSGIFDETILSQTNRKKALVNCLLYLTGNLLHPIIAFDLNLPNSDDELNRSLKNIVNTDEIMNREIIYLLALGAFTNPNGTTNSAATTQSEVVNMVASTLSQQLNNMASQLFDKWNFGLNVNIDDGTATPDGIKNNEVSMIFVYTPNDKITINGNVGYKDGETATSALKNYILDFEIEYKLSGRFSAKAYNRTNNYIEFKENAPYTQGIGIVYRENFNSIAELRANWKKARQQSIEAKKQRQQQRQAKKSSKNQKKLKIEN